MGQNVKEYFHMTDYQPFLFHLKHFDKCKYIFLGNIDQNIPNKIVMDTFIYSILEGNNKVLSNFEEGDIDAYMLEAYISLIKEALIYIFIKSRIDTIRILMNKSLFHKTDIIRAGIISNRKDLLKILVNECLINSNDIS